MPTVSVVIPAYNAMTYLPAAVDSVLKQTFSDFEVLIVDDGSTDQTAQWVTQLTDRRVKLISQPNQGAAAARNTGIAHAQGDYIAFLDADDLWEPSKLEKQVQRLEAQPQVGLVHTWTAFIDAEGQPTGRIMTSHGEGQVWSQMVVYNLLRCGSTAMVRRECFERLGQFDRNLRYAEDWDMWLRIAKDYDFALVHEPLVFYREHANNKSKNYEGQLQSFCQILEKAFQSAPPELNGLKKRAYGRAYLHAAWRALVIGQDAEKAHFLWRQALAFDPKLYVFGHSVHLGLRLIKVRYPLLGLPIEAILLVRRKMLNWAALRARFARGSQSETA